jgi:hypothetical protein
MTTAASAQILPKLLAKQRLDARLIIDHKNQKTHAVPLARLGCSLA